MVGLRLIRIFLIICGIQYLTFASEEQSVGGEKNEDKNSYQELYRKVLEMADEIACLKAKVNDLSGKAITNIRLCSPWESCTDGFKGPNFSYVISGTSEWESSPYADVSLRKLITSNRKMLQKYVNGTWAPVRSGFGNEDAAYNISA